MGVDTGMVRHQAVDGPSEPAPVQSRNQYRFMNVAPMDMFSASKRAAATVAQSAGSSTSHYDVKQRWEDDQDSKPWHRTPPGTRFRDVMLGKGAEAYSKRRSASRAVPALRSGGTASRKVGQAIRCRKTRCQRPIRSMAQRAGHACRGLSTPAPLFGESRAGTTAGPILPRGRVAGWRTPQSGNTVCRKGVRAWPGGPPSIAAAR